MIISFGKTYHLLPKKTVTRRNWTERHFQQVLWMWKSGNRRLDAYDKNPRNGGVKIGVIDLTAEPFRQRLADMPAADLEKEGGDCLTVKEFAEKYFEGDLELNLAVVNFRFTSEKEGDRDADT